MARIIGLGTLAALTLASIAAAATFGGWSTARSAETFEGADPALNTSALEGCAAISRNDRDLYFASDRPGGLGGIDIWVSRRERSDDPWGQPEHLGAPINSPFDDFCPSPTRDGHGFLFVSGRPGGCGPTNTSDIYRTRESPRGWAPLEHLPCSVNSAGNEAGPFLLPGATGKTLYFSSTVAGGFASDPPGNPTGDADLYTAAQGADGSFEARVLIPGLNTASNDARPNLRRDGLEIFFDSNRVGGIGGFDLWSATRASESDAWEAPQNLGPQVNSTAGETRSSLSWDGKRLYFGSNRPGGEGSSDIYVTTRERLG